MKLASTQRRPLHSLHGSPNLYDESLTASGELRAHWQQLGRTLEKLGREELSVRAENARRVIRENGVTYNVYGDPQGWIVPGSST